MKNIKIILLFFICLVAGSVLAQYVPYVPPTPIPAYNVPPQTFSGNYTSGTQNNVACNALVNQLYTSGTVSYSIKASNYVHITQPCSFQSASSSTFHAFIAPSGIDVVSYHPNGFSDIPRYDKFELGIKLPQNITDNINNFFGNKYYPAYDVHNPPYYNCNNGYGSIFDTNYINPYNPDQISLEATFSFPGKPDETVYGFYYREYTYDQADPTTGAPSYSATNWVEDTGLQYHWRVRFAPKYVGTYTVTWVVKVSGGGIVSILSDNIGQNFISISSTNPGFIKIGQNGKFLVTQPDPAGSQKTIIPVGVGVPFPAQGLIGTDGIPLNECPLYGCGYPWGLNTNNYSYPSRFWHHRDKIKTELSANGGNIVRIFNSPFSYDIEWEKAGVYDADQFKPIGPQGPNIGYQTPLQAQTYYKGNNRQAVMWEFDRMLDMAKDNNLYIQWVTEEGADNGFRAAGVGPDWSLNPYYNGVFLNPTDPLHIDQFFTDANAIAFYKKRLRYMIARYGYSTNIADFELVNEIHEFRGDNLPYNTNNTLDALFTPWLTTMTDYIKNPIVAGG